MRVWAYALCAALALSLCVAEPGCSADYQFCSDKKKPYCLERNGNYGCYACASECDCGNNQYCSTAVNSNKFGTCVDIKFIGHKCASYPAASFAAVTSEDKLPVLGCAQWDSDSGTPWPPAGGPCVDGHCAHPMCGQSWGSLGYALFCNGGAQGNSGTKGVRACVNGRVYSFNKGLGFIPQVFQYDRAAVLLMIILVFIMCSFIMQIVSFAVRCCCSGKSASDSYVRQ